MFYFLSKTIGYFLTPAGWLLALLVGALAFRRQRRRLLVGALALFWVLGNPFLVNELARIWELNGCAPPPPRPAQDTTVRVAVVLTGALTNNNLQVTPARPLLAPQGDRLAQALFLYKTGRVQKILISGGAGSAVFGGEETRPEGRESMTFLALAGVRPQDMRWETHSRNTRENALFSAQSLRREFHTNRCVLVTSAFHLRRATACFTKVGLTVTPFPAAYIQQPRRFYVAELLLPHEEAFADAMHLLRELFGYVAYRLAGYV